MDTSVQADNHPGWLDPATEWKECRATISRLDSVIADIRKYSFSLVTILITASGFLGRQGSTPAAGAAVPVAIMILIVALFAVDRNYTLLLNGAVERALDLEGETINRSELNKDSLTQVISVYAIDSLSVFVAPALYIGLLFATRLLASAISDQGIMRSGVGTAFKWCLWLTVAYFLYTEVRRPTGFFRRKRFIRRY
jgi:hypothetical protein